MPAAASTSGSRRPTWPRFEVVQHDAGVSIAARRKLGEDRNYIRTNQFLMPFWTLVPPFSQFRI